MRFKNVCIEGLACHLPENVVTSTDLERRLAPIYDRLKLPYGRLEMMSGIKERRFWDAGIFPSQVAAIAGEKAIEFAEIDRTEIGCLINASVCRDFLEPATASIVHQNLKLQPNCLVFDISNACLGVLNGMVHIANMIELGQIRAGLIVAGKFNKFAFKTNMNDEYPTFTPYPDPHSTYLGTLAEFGLLGFFWPYRA